MINAIQAGLIYFVVVFAVGFMLGTIRALIVSPYLGEGTAVAVELPIILAVSWIVCSRIITHQSMSDRFVVRALMGGTALSFLLVAEAILSMTLAQRSLLEHFKLYSKFPSLLGLMGQLIFALFPYIQSQHKKLPERNDLRD